MEKLGKLLFSCGATHIYPSIKGQASFTQRNFNNIGSNIDKKNLRLFTVHLMGTCPIGNNENACTKENGQLKGEENIYISDSSLIPTSLGVNPQGTIMAICRKNAVQFLEKFS